MKNVYWASLCYEGAHGGGLYLRDNYLRFRTNKIQLPENIRTIDIPLADILSIWKGKALYIFPAITVTLRSGIRYKFIIFRRTDFLKNFQQLSNQI